LLKFSISTTRLEATAITLKNRGNVANINFLNIKNMKDVIFMAEEQ